jgi:nucleoside-diphosphate-sugar epimerase
MDVRKSVADPIFDAETNILGTIDLLAAARDAGVKKFLFVSSGGAVYGEQETFPAPETHPTWPVSPYGVSKRSGELLRALLHGGVQAAVRRRSATRTSTGRARTRTARPASSRSSAGKMLRGEPVTVNGDGKQTRDYVFVGDVARMSALALETDATGTGERRHRHRDRRERARRACSEPPRSRARCARPGEVGRAEAERRRHPPRRRRVQVAAPSSRSATAWRARSSSSGRSRDARASQARALR